jgi:preprotein translocase subunit SecD
MVMRPLVWAAAPIAAAALSTAAAQPLMLEVASARVEYDQRTAQAIVSFEMTEGASKLFTAFTSQNIGRAIEFRVDGRTIHKAIVREPIVGGSGQLLVFSADEARTLAARLSEGTAKLEVEVAAK